MSSQWGRNDEVRVEGRKGGGRYRTREFTAVAVSVVYIMFVA